MNDLKMQQNFGNNLQKVFEKISEEGKRGIDGDNNCYPIEEIQVETLRSLTGDICDTKIVIKDYNNYRKLIQTLDTLINMYSRLYGDDFEVSDKIKTVLIEEIGVIQTTGLKSLDKGYISQYSCLIKCYDSLSRMNERFLWRSSKEDRNSNLPQYKARDN